MWGAVKSINMKNLFKGIENKRTDYWYLYHCFCSTVQNQKKVLLNLKISAETLYLLAFCIYLTGAVWSTTMFPIRGLVIRCCRLMAIGLILWKVIFFDCFSERMIKGIIALIIIVLAIKVLAGYSEPYIWVFFCIGAKDVSFDKILRCYFTISLSIILSAFFASVLGVIENLKYETGSRGVRNAFGIVYPTDFAAHIFFLILVFFYIRKDKGKIHEYVICLFMSVLVLQFCDARLDSACICLTAIGHMYLKYRWTQKRYLKKNYQKRVRKPIRLWKCVAYSMPVGMAVMGVLTILYHVDILFMYEINEWLSNRLLLQDRGMIEYGIRLFGQYIKMVGNGGTVIFPEDYFFIDCSYFYIMMQYGIIFLFCVFYVYGICCRKFRNDQYFLLTVFLIAVNCMIAHHLLDLAYNPFALSLFAKIPENLKEQYLFRSELDYK